MSKNRFIITAVVFLFLFKAYSQRENLYKNKLALNVGYGRVLPHYNFIYRLSQKPVNSFEINYSTLLVNDSIWDKIYKYPELGVKLGYVLLGNNNVLGEELFLAGNVKFNLVKNSKINFYSRPSLGVSYVNKKYDNFNNSKNLAVGSSLNIHFDFQLGVDYAISKQIDLSTGINFGHYSNGNTVSPNLGLNYISLFVGLAKRFNEIDKTTYTKVKFNQVKEQSIYLYAGAGYRNSSVISPPLNISASYRKSVSRKYLLGGGIDLFYDEFIAYSLKNNNKPYRNADNFNVGVFINQSLRYDDFYFTLNQGVYITKNKIQNSSYFRAELMYLFYKKIYTRISIKTHFFTAQYPEIGFGLKL